MHTTDLLLRCSSSPKASRSLKWLERFFKRPHQQRWFPFTFFRKQNCLTIRGRKSLLVHIRIGFLKLQKNRIVLITRAYFKKAARFWSRMTRKKCIFIIPLYLAKSLDFCISSSPRYSCLPCQPIFKTNTECDNPTAAFQEFHVFIHWPVLIVN